MSITQEEHDAITEFELLALIHASEGCDCGFDCYCAKNIEWAERKLERLRRSKAVSVAESNDGMNSALFTSSLTRPPFNKGNE